VLGLGALCSVLIPADWDRRLTYAGAGLTNAFAAILLLAGNRPSVYFWGTLLYLVTTGLCNARFVALLLDVIGPDDRDPSTWFSALLAAGNIPIASMIWLEGQSFSKFGTHGLLWTDAAVKIISDREREKTPRRLIQERSRFSKQRQSKNVLGHRAEWLGAAYP
jgi:hypothetical protein